MKKIEGKKAEIAGKMVAYHPDKSKGESYIPYAHPSVRKNLKIERMNKAISKRTLGSSGKNEGETMMGNNRTERNRS